MDNPHPLQGREAPRITNFTEATAAYRQVWSVRQAANGFWYFGTSGGMLEYDGTWWNRFQLPNSQPVRALTCGSNGKIYTGGFEELGYWAPDPDLGLRYQSLVELVDPAALDKEEIWNIVPYMEGIYFQSFSRIYKFRGGQVYAIQPPQNIMFMRVIHDKLIVPVIDRGLYQLNADDTFTFIQGSERFAGTEIKLLIEQPGGAFLIGTEDDGVFQYRAGKFLPWNIQLNEQLLTYQLNTGVGLHNGDLALGTLLNGVFIVDAQGNIRYHLNRTAGLQNNTVLSLHEDQRGDLWIGTDNGIDLAELSAPLTFFDDRLGAIGTVYCAARFQDRLYLGTNQGLFLRRLDAASDAFTLVAGTQGQVWSLKVVDNRLYCGHNVGTFQVEGDRVQLISEVNGGWEMHSHPEDPTLFIQGTYTGLVAYRRTPSGLKFLGRIANFPESCRTLAFDSKGQLWGAHPSRGLFKVQLDIDRLQVSNAREFGEQNGLPTTYQLSLVKNDGQVLVKAGGMFFRYHPIADQFIDANFPKSRPGEEIRLNAHFIFPRDTFWVGTNEVAWHYPGGRRKLQLSLVPRYPEIIELGAGRYLFGLKNGYAVLDTRKKGNKLPSGHLHIRRIEAPSRTVHLTQEDALVHFGSKDHNLGIYFSHTDPARTVRYEYQLEGLSETWHSVEQKAYQSFTNLRGGQYTFRLRTQEAPGEVATVAISIAYLWWETPLAKFGLIVFIFGLFFLMHRWYQYRLQQIRRVKEKQLQEERIRSRNEKLQAEIIAKSKELANTANNLIRKNELLIELQCRLKDLKPRNGQGIDADAYYRLYHLIDHNITNDADRALFETNLEEVHESFFKALLQSFPDLTPGDLRLAAYLRMNLTTKEIAPLLNISVRGVENKRYRLRKKMGLDADENLTEFMMQF